MSELSQLLADRLEIFFGEATDTLCYVYARLDDSRTPAGSRLVGTVRGPRCMYAQTLPATYTLKDRGPGAGLLAEAIVTDTCFWTPRSPQLYDVVVELKHGPQTLATAQRQLGVRPLGVQKQKLLLERKRWVLRGALQSAVPREPLSAWHDAATAMIVENPSDELCAEASRVGVLLVALASGSAAEIVDELRRLARWPAVGVAVLQSSDTLDVDVRAVARNPLLVQMVNPRQSARLAPWAHLALGEIESGGLPGGDEIERLSELVRGVSAPVIALRKGAGLTNVVEARAQCDRLQRDLAPAMDLAGYIV